MSLSPLQRSVDDWVAANGGYWDEMSLLARLMEEVGELSREYNHQFGAKQKKPSEGDRALEDEMGDVLFILACMANQQGIDLDAAVARCLEKYQSRDAGRWS